MTRPSLTLLIRPAGDGYLELRAPGVGTYSGSPQHGEGLRPGSRAGTLRVLGRVFDLLVPADVAGEVADVHTHHLVDPVAYGDPLLTLVVRSGGEAAEGGSDRASSIGSAADQGTGLVDLGEDSGTSHRSGAGGAGARASEGLLPGEHALRATTAGVFYARPDQASPPFVTAGGTLEAGQTAGLIEVMKCFSPIVHPGGAIPSPAFVREVRASEGSEVLPGQILFVLRPI